jgi:hypothetical protein
MEQLALQEPTVPMAAMEPMALWVQRVPMALSVQPALRV